MKKSFKRNKKPVRLSLQTSSFCLQQDKIMSEINHQDLIIITHAALLMAKKDQHVDQKEKDFLKKLMLKAEVHPHELAGNMDIRELAKKLSSKLAKQVFLLALAAVARADLRIDAREQAFFKQLAYNLKVGEVDLERHSQVVLEKMVLDHLKD